MAFASLLDTVQRTATEDFGTLIREATHDVDPWSKRLVTSSMGVSRDGLGRGWKKIAVFKTGLAGAASWRSVAGNAPVVTNENTQFGIYGSPQTFPGATKHTVPAYHQTEVGLKEMYGSFTVPTEIMRLDLLSTNIANQVAAILEGTARRVALREILAFWAGSNGEYVDLTIKTAENVTVPANGAFTGILDADDGLTYYDCLRFQPGECLDAFYDDGGTWTKANDAPIFVLISDPLNLQVVVSQFSGNATTLTGAVTYYFLPEGTGVAGGLTTSALTHNGPTPLQTVITNTSTDTPYGLDLAKYPYHRSVVQTGLDVPLTEMILNRWVGLAIASKAAGDRIDSCVTTPGVKAEYVASLDYSGRREANRTPIRLSEGFGESFGYSYDGTEMPIEVSNFCPRGTLFGLKTRNGNWQKIEAPRVPGTGTNSQFGGSVEFLGNITQNSIYFPVFSSSEVTDNLQAPFKRWLEFMPEYIPGLKLSGLHEALGAYDGTD